MAVTQINSQKIQDGTVDTGDLKDGCVTVAKTAAGVGHALFTSVVNSTSIANSTTETEFDQKFTMPANYLTAGKIIKMKFWGRYTQSSGSVTLRVYIGTSNWLDFGSFTPTTTATSRGWCVEVTLICVSTGTSGAVRGGAVMTFNNLASPVLTSVADFAVNTTVTRDLKMTAQWSVANAGNTIITSLVEMTEF